jgi:hypothetical protein
VASELHSLEAQLRPHFLFNTLHRIATLSNGWLLPRPNGLLVPRMILQPLTQLSQLRTFFGFFALIFVVKPCVFIVAL